MKWWKMWMKFFGDHKVHWIHFGKKHKLSFHKDEVDSEGVFEILMRKVKDAEPDFGDLIAYNDFCGRQIIIKCDDDFHTAMHESKHKLKIYTTIAESGKTPTTPTESAELPKPARSYSVPPMGKPSLDLQRLSIGPRQSRLTVEPAQPTFRRFSARQRSRESPISPSSCDRVSTTMSYSPSYSYGSHIPIPRPVNYGYPPPNFLLGLFLTGGHAPFYGRDPFLGVAHHGFGNWNGRGYYNTAWGPVF